MNIFNATPLFSLVLLLFSIPLFAQHSTERVPISETYSTNAKFMLRSVSYDHQYPNLIGESTVTYNDKYESPGIKKVLYRIERSFDLSDSEPFFVALSNDGRKILYLIDRNYHKGEENQQATYYVDGKLTKTYTAETFTNCDKQKEKCGMFYPSNYKLYQERRSTFKQYREGVTEQEKFLEKNFVFNKNDTVYLIDARKKVTLFDLNKGEIIQNNIELHELYPKIAGIEAVKSRISYYRYPFKYLTDIQRTQDGKQLSAALGELLNLKYVHMDDTTFRRYAHYKIDMGAYLHRNGRLQLVDFNPGEGLDSIKIRNYLENTTFETTFMPREVDKLYLNHFFGGYRSPDEEVAKAHTRTEMEKSKLAAQKRLTAERIGEHYIPKNLQECMIELDKILNFQAKQQLGQSKMDWEFNSHGGGLGTWIRNNWGLHGGSRLLVYFKNRGIGNDGHGADQISGTIITQYKKWLEGQTNAWKQWEKEHPLKKN